MTLRFVEDGLPQALKPLLHPIGLHEGHVYADYLAAMAKAARQPFTPQAVQQALHLLEAAGLAQGIGNDLFRLHPALTRYLRARAQAFAGSEEEARAWERGFIDVMAQLAHSHAQRPPHEQRAFFAIFGGCVDQARRLAETGDGSGVYAALMQALAFHAQNRRNWPLAQRYFEALARHCEAHGEESFGAGAYHQLGMVAQERRDFEAAEGWYRKSLEIKERLGIEDGAARTYHQLGMVAEERRDFEAAEGWYRKSLEIEERQGNEHGAAITYHQLGVVAQERQDFEAAEGWYRKSLEIKERQGNEHGAAITYHQLGRVAQERRDFEAAEGWYRKSLVR